MFAAAESPSTRLASLQKSDPVTVTGTLSGGGTLTQTFVTDALGDGPGPLADFQTFSLIGFNDVISVQFASIAKPFAIDNINVTESSAPVPEPASLFLLGSGLSGLAALVRRRRKNKL